MCSGIVFALESEVPGSNLGAGTDSALGTTIGDEDVEKEFMLQFICVDTYFITDYCVFCGINAGLFKRNRIVYRPQHCGRWNHPTQVSSLQKGVECSDGGDSSALSGQTLLCSGIVFALESEVPGSNLGAGTDSALQNHRQINRSSKLPLAQLNIRRKTSADIIVTGSNL